MGKRHPVYKDSLTISNTNYSSPIHWQHPLKSRVYKAKNTQFEKFRTPDPKCYQFFWELLSLDKFNPLLPESTLQTTARGPPSFKDSPCIFGANDIRGFCGGSETVLVLVLFMNMKTSIHPYQMLKYRYIYVPDDKR